MGNDDVVAIWKVGLFDALSCLLRLKAYELNIEEYGVSLKKPHGKVIGVGQRRLQMPSSTASTDDDIAPEVEVIDDELDNLNEVLSSSKTITIDGKEVHKATVLKQLLSSEPVSKLQKID